MPENKRQNDYRERLKDKIEHNVSDSNENNKKHYRRIYGKELETESIRSGNLIITTRNGHNFMSGL